MRSAQPTVAVALVACLLSPLDVGAQGAATDEGRHIQSASTAIQLATGELDEADRPRVIFDRSLSLDLLRRQAAEPRARWANELRLPEGARVRPISDFFDCPGNKLSPRCVRSRDGTVLYVTKIEEAAADSTSVRVTILRGEVGTGVVGFGVVVSVTRGSDGLWSEGSIQKYIAW